MSNALVSRPTPQSLRRIIPLIVIVVGLMVIGAMLIQQVVAQESRTLKPPFRLILSDKSSRAPTGILPPLDAPIIMSQTFDSSYQPVSSLGQVGWHQLVGSGATNGYTWARTNGQLITNTVWCALLNPSGSPLLDPATGTYTNGMEALLVYGPIDLSDYHTVILSTTSWLDTPADGDYYGVAVSTDGSIFRAASLETNADASLSMSRTMIYNLSDSAAERPAVWIGVYFASNNDSINRRGAFLQQIVLRAVPLNKTYMPLMIKNYPPTPTPTATPQSIRYAYTFTDETTSNNPDFNRWGGDRSTSCGTVCTFYQSLARNLGNPGNAFTLWLQGVNGKGGAAPRQNNVSLSTATNFEYSADVYVYNGQLDARYGLAFDATSGTFPDSGNPPMNPYVNYYLLEMNMDTATRTKVATWQLLRIVNGDRQPLTNATNLPISINQGQWHNLKVVQQNTTISFYLNGSFMGSAYYDPNWGNERRRFGLYIDVRASNGASGPFEFFSDNIIVRDLP